MKMKTPLIDGALSQIGSEFVSEKQKLGYSYSSNAYIVRDFSRFIETHKQFAESNTLVSKMMIEKWLASHAETAPKSIKTQINTIRQLAMFMNRNGVEAYVLPTLCIPKQKCDFNAYIFSYKQLASIFQELDVLKYSPVSPFRHIAMPLLFRMIYACGLRSSEATGLKLRDVDFINGIVHIRDSKFNKSRIIPIAESLCMRCKEYSQVVHKNCTYSDFFFSNAYKGEYHTSSIYTIFRDILYKCNIPRVEHGPRVHDLRHTYAVHILKRWSLEKKDLTSALPLLCTYMGHADISGTQKYLQLTSELYPHIITQLEDFYSDRKSKGGVIYGG